MYTPIVKERIEDIIRSISSSGARIGKTLESQNVEILLDLTNFNWEKEKRAVSELLRKHGLSLEEKYDEEEFHYKFLEYSLLQKFRAVKYFHNQDIESRKIVIFSEDCISLIQWMTRHKLSQNYMNVYIRSSDALGLLATDLLYLCSLAQSVMSEHPEVKQYRTSMKVLVASCHIYLNEETGKPQTRDGVEIAL